MAIDMLFAIMINGFIGSFSKYADMQEEILCTMLVDDQTRLTGLSKSGKK